MRMMKRWVKNGFILTAAAVCAFSIPIAAAQAAFVTYSFNGSVDGPMFPVSGSFQFDNETGGSGGAYNGAVTGFNLTIGGLGYTSSFTPGANAITVLQNIPMAGGGHGDRWALVSGASGPDLNGTGFTPFSFDLRLDVKEGGLGTSLQDPPSLSSLNGGRARWRLFFEDSDGNPAVFLGSVTSLTAVPLPAAVLLFGAGLISLVGLGVGGLRNLRGTQA
jgi:hypothetical protein